MFEQIMEIQETVEVNNSSGKFTFVLTAQVVHCIETLKIIQQHFASCK